MATSAIAFAGAVAAAPASAADMLAVGVGGYMQQWFGYADRGDDNSEGGIDIQSDSEVYFQGSLDSDMGMKYTVHVQLEANQDGNKAAQIDESFARVSGEFGTVEIGARDPIHARTHYGISDVGVGLNAGDTQKWVNGAYLDTNGWIGDNLNVIYISPRVSGVQVGFSYGADTGSESAVTSSPDGNDDSVWAAGINFNQAVGEMAFKASLGHRSASQSGSTSYMSYGPEGDTVGAAMTKSYDNDTFTNVGAEVSFGSFKLNAAYAMRDKGAYVGIDGMPGMPGVPGVPGVPAVEAVAAADEQCFGGADNASIPCFTDHDSDPDTDDIRNPAIDRTIPAVEAVDAVDAVPAVDPVAATDGTAGEAVEDEAGEWNVWGVSVTYTEGPMSVSLGHMQHETDAGTERTSTMLSGSYSLAPGVAWKSSVFQVEDNTGGDDNEGTAFVTGITLNF